MKRHAGDGSPGQGDLRVGGRAAGWRRRTSQVGFDARRKALQQGSVAGSGGARRGVARQISASQGGVARRCSRATSQGQAAQGRASQGSSLLSRIALIPCGERNLREREIEPIDEGG